MAKEPKKIDLKRYEDGMPSALRKATFFQELHFYRKSEVLVQLTKSFCDRFLPKYGDRTVDQMVQAARSIKQNIAEGCTDGQTSMEVEIKLLGIARGSNQELLEDYKDYLNHHHIAEWALHNTDRFDRLREYAKAHSDVEDYMPFFDRWSDEEMANCAICLCHMVDKAMCSFIANKDREFVEQGGIRERMTAARLDYRSSQKETIEALLEEIAQLKAENEALKRELDALRNAPAKTGESGGTGSTEKAGSTGSTGKTGGTGEPGGTGKSEKTGSTGKTAPTK